MKYLTFISDHDLLAAIGHLYTIYFNSFMNKSFEDLNKHKIDAIKFQFDTAFLYGGDEKLAINNENFRQNDKTISNAIGSLHQKLLGKLVGFEETPHLPCDIRKTDDTIFAEVKNKHNTMNARSAESVFAELTSLARSYPQATCYLVEIIANNSQNLIWEISVNKTKQSNPKVRRISADNFYALATGKELAFKELCTALPDAIADYLSQNNKTTTLGTSHSSKAYEKLQELSHKQSTTVMKQILSSTFKEYKGF